MDQFSIKRNPKSYNQIYSPIQMRQGAYSTPKYLNNYGCQTTKKWPQDIQCIIKSSNPEYGSLYLSNVEAAQNPSTVKRLNVKAILSCAKGYIISHPKTLVPHYMYIPGQDKQTFNISRHFDEAVEFIQRALQKTNIIVHCIAGVSRSVSMVIAYFMKCKNMSYNQAYHQVKSKRKIISPNDGFIKHLKQLQIKLKSSKSMSPRKIADQQKKTDEKTRGDYLNLTGNFYTPKKTYEYYKSIQLTRHNPNPQLSLKQQFLKKQSNFQTTTVSPTMKNSSNINDYRNFSQSMAFIPESKHNLISQTKYGLSASKALSPRKSNDWTVTKPREIKRQVLYENRPKSGYFDSMNQQLNQKIQNIRKKYQQQRSQMMKSYGSRESKSQNSPKANIYLDKRSVNLQRTFTDKSKYARTIDKFQASPYDRQLNARLNWRDNVYESMHTRTNTFNSVYVPRVTTSYGGSYGRGYY